MTVSPDLRLGERYTLLSPLAAGGMGEVWRARDDLLGRSVAVKLLRPGLPSEPEVLRRFREEARHAAALSHPGIAGVFDYGESGDLAYLVMELVEGEPLSTLLSREGPLAPGRALDIVGQAGLALQAAHDAGVVHRDVKPANILIRPDGVVKLTDFGIARALDSATITRTGAVLGTAAYLSPEQASGRQVGPSSDLYSLGLVAYECLVGRRAFGAETPVALALAQIHEPAPPLPLQLPEPVRELVSRALAKDAADRWPTTGEFARRALALASRYGGAPALTDTSVTQPLPVPGPQGPPTSVLARREPSRRQVRAGFIATAAVVLIGGFFLLRSCAIAARVRLPEVVGEARASALAVLHKDGLAVRLTSASSKTVGAGRVISERPRPGSLVDQGATVVLAVSSGPPMVRVDSATYQDQPFPVVAAALRRLGLQVHEVFVATDAVAPATVLSVAPSGLVQLGTTETVQAAIAIVRPAPPPAPGAGSPGQSEHGKHKDH
ncbi:MAG: protein kinase domain-containing protein [Mycobacteriales bacterium]